MSSDVAVWAQRKHALDQVIGETIKWAEGDLRELGDSFEDGQRQACLDALRALQLFGGAAFNFFDRGFRSGYLKRSKEYSHRYVLRTIFDQISVDFNLLQKAIFQRRHAGKGRGTEQTAQSKTLAMADHLACHALKPAHERGFIRESAVTVVTHLARKFEIRVLPYDDVVLIGIPYTTYRVRSTASGSSSENDDAPTLDFLGIPHEVGHYLFERGKVPGTESYVDVFLKRALLDGNLSLREGDWRVRWLEELFTDAYGCLIAGPVNVLSLQELLKDNRPSTLRQDAGEHPIPILRPLIQTRILRKITDDQGNPRYLEAPDRLDQAWLQWIGDPDALAKEYALRNVDTKISGQAIVQALDEIIDVILDTLSHQPHQHPESVVHAVFEAMDKPAPGRTSSVWTTDLASGSDSSELIDQFRTRCDEFMEEECSVVGEMLRDEHEKTQAVDRFKARLDEFSAHSRTVDELITFVLFEDWESELFEEDVGLVKPQGPGLEW
jgi:hypothetical protein